MGRFVFLLLCLVYLSWPQGLVGQGLISGDGVGTFAREFAKNNPRYFSMKCPNGEIFSVRVVGDANIKKRVLESMKSSCERKPPYCQYDLDNPDLDCSAAKGLLKQYRMEAACIIHDLCYMQFGDTDKKRCDKDFRHNLKELCKGPWWNIFSPWLLNCGTVPGVAYLSVKNHGDSDTSFHKNSKERKCRNQFISSQVAPIIDFILDYES